MTQRIIPKFRTPLITTMLNDKLWELHGDLVYDSRVFGGTITVPAGFVTDFASVPRTPLAYSLFGNIAHEGAVVHDFLYQRHLKNKATADSIFLEAMKVQKIPLWRRLPMYWAVRFFGGSSYEDGVERFKVLNTKGGKSK